MDWTALLALVGSMAGVAALGALVINVLKFFGVVKDTTAPTWSAGFNLLILIVVFVFGVFQIPVDWNSVNQIAGAIAAFGASLLTFLAQLVSSKITHEIVRGLPVIGKSFSVDRKKALAYDVR